MAIFPECPAGGSPRWNYAGANSGDVLLSDTVGFIRRLPDRLFASFASTLAEISEASLLLVVVDGSDPEVEEHLRLIETVLAVWARRHCPGWSSSTRAIG